MPIRTGEDAETVVGRVRADWGVPSEHPPPSGTTRTIDVEEPARDESRYREVGVLGRGGMGEVLLVEDRRIGRLVARKQIPEDFASGSLARSRFVREARVQGQLEHTSVVPVYDFGWDESGTEYFTMKRVTGLTLRQISNGLSENRPEIVARFSRHRLLAIFQQLCLAIDYAHQRGVVHRDLKPTNIMIGDFGEVYVLDWGIAKVGGMVEPASNPVVDSPSDESTRADDILGTPGYMSPEQMRNSSAVDGRADVYSLGAILYLMLARKPLVPRDVANSIDAIEAGAFDPRPSIRWTDDDEPPPPELDAVCARALAIDPENRYPTARALHDAIDAFLEGRRDTDLRRKLADDYAAMAAAALDDRSSDPDRARGEAMKRAAHALAIDPTHPGAAHLMTRLLLEPPRVVPPEARESIRREFRDVLRASGTLAALLVLGFCVAIPLLYVFGMRNPWTIASLFGPLVLAAAIAATLGRAPARWQAMQITGLSLCLAITFGVSSGIYGPYVLTPVFAQAMISIGCSQPSLGRARIIMVAFGFASFLFPMLLEWTDIVPHAYTFDGPEIVVHPRLAPFPELPARIGLTAATAGAIFIATAVCWRASTDHAKQQRDLHVVAWHLRKLVPDSVRSSVPDGGEVSGRPDGKTTTRA